jgi:uncharacterized protein (DUF488 family)
VFTVGHGTLAADELNRLLHGAGIEHLVDVRSYPGSRRNPQHGRAQLEHSLPAAGLTYAWEPWLGGRRRPRPESLNVALHNDAFRGYADHMASPEFHRGLDELISTAGAASVAVMCAESLWWHCHRRLLADALVVLRGVPVMHLFHDGRQVGHRASAEARVVDGDLLYDVGNGATLL